MLLVTIFNPLKDLHILKYNFTIEKVVFEIKCTAEHTDNHLWYTKIYFNAISIETCRGMLCN